ncbi:MAG: hypothetical protein GY854_26160 [Deltaproteobacteria bacterium]|nr:hypothetical protein [Deltaproteobacteria bacterium]
MSSYRKPGRLVWLWGLIPLVVVAEMFIQWQIPKSDPPEEDWKEAARAIAAEKQKQDLVVVAPDWAVQGRMHFKDLISLKNFGRVDTSTYERIYEVSIDGARAKETEGLTAESVSTFGRLTVSRYKLPPRVKVLFDFIARARAAEVSGFKRKNPRIVIDHWFHPRLVIPVQLSRKTVSLTFKDVPLGGTLRLFAIIGYRSGRFNKGGPVTISAHVDDNLIGAIEVKNFGPKEPSYFTINRKGKGTVRFDIRARDGLKREFGFAADVRRESGDSK